MGVGVGRIRRAGLPVLPGKPNEFGQGVLAVVGDGRTAAGAIGDRGIGAVAVHVDDLVRVGRVFLGQFQDGQGIGAGTRRVGIRRVATDDVVQRATQLPGAAGVDLVS